MFCFSLLLGYTETALQESNESAFNQVSYFHDTASYREYIKYILSNAGHTIIKCHMNDINVNKQFIVSIL